MEKGYKMKRVGRPIVKENRTKIGLSIDGKTLWPIVLYLGYRFSIKNSLKGVEQ